MTEEKKNWMEIDSGKAVQESLTPAELDALVDLWAIERYKMLTELSEIRRQAGEAVTDEILMSDEWMASYRKDLRQHFQDVLEDGDMVVARVNGLVVGMIEVFKLEDPVSCDLFEGEVYEIGKAIVLPDYRRKGIYKEMRSGVLAVLREKYGDVPVMSATQDDGVKKTNRAEGWTEVPFDYYLRFHGMPEGYIDMKRHMNALAGFTAFLHVPETLKRKD